MKDYSKLKSSETALLVQEKIKALKDNGHLPRGYARIIMERYPEITKDMVYNATNGRPSSEMVQNAIIELAAENRDVERLKKLDELLGNK